jgi:hypothetical protein
MASNIGTVQVDVNPICDPILVEHAAEIRRLGKRVKEDVVAIGRHLVEARDHAGHGVWLEWLKTEFDWSDQTAYRFMHVYEAQQKSEFHKLWNSDLPLSGLYALAAPNTPPEARQKVAERLDTGEHMSCQEIKATIVESKRRKRNAEAPTAPVPIATSGNDIDAEASAETRKSLISHSETLLDHWQRDSKAERAAFLDELSVDGLLAAASDEFKRGLCRRVPATKPPLTAEARAAFLDQIGMTGIVAVLTPEQKTELHKLLAPKLKTSESPRAKSPSASSTADDLNIPDDLSIPKFLRRAPECDRAQPSCNSEAASHA